MMASPGVMCAQVVWSYSFSLLFLHASVSWFGALGSLMIAAGAIMVNIRRRPPAAPLPAKPSEPGLNEAETGRVTVLSGSSEEAVREVEGHADSSPLLGSCFRGEGSSSSDKATDQAPLLDGLIDSAVCRHSTGPIGSIGACGTENLEGEAATSPRCGAGSLEAATAAAAGPCSGGSTSLAALGECGCRAPEDVDEHRHLIDGADDSCQKC